MGICISDDRGQWVELSGGFSEGDLSAAPALVAERRDQLNFAFGESYMVQILLPNIYIVYGDMQLKKHYFRMRSQNSADMLELHFALSGEGKIENHLTGRTYAFQSNQHNLVYVPEFDGTGDYNNKKNAYRFFEIHFETHYFLRLVHDSCPGLNRFASMVAQRKHTDLAPYNLPISFAMHQCIRDIMDCNLTGGLKLLFIQSKCIELLTLQAEAFEQAQGNIPSSALKSSYDRDCIIYAKEYLLQHLHAPPSLSHLALLAGVNEFKLKKGFKELFSNTVFGYMNDARLDLAKQLLLSGTSIREAADELGYSSVQHFSSSFCKRFGVPPGKIRS